MKSKCEAESQRYRKRGTQLILKDRSVTATAKTDREGGRKVITHVVAMDFISVQTWLRSNHR